MTPSGDNLFDLFERNALPLLDCKRIVGWFQDDARALVVRPEKDVTFNLARFWVTTYPVAEPSEAGRFIWTNRRGPAIKDVPKALLRH